MTLRAQKFKTRCDQKSDDVAVCAAEGRVQTCSSLRLIACKTTLRSNPPEAREREGNGGVRLRRFLSKIVCEDGNGS
jgi:hypothetical protein